MDKMKQHIDHTFHSLNRPRTQYEIISDIIAEEIDKVLINQMWDHLNDSSSSSPSTEQQTS